VRRESRTLSLWAANDGQTRPLARDPGDARPQTPRERRLPCPRSLRSVEAQRLLRGPGSRKLYRLWHDLIRWEPGLLVLVGDGLVPGLFRGDAERSLKPYMTTVDWEHLSGEWARTYSLLSTRPGFV
jgi:hypothetical protein